MSAGKELRKKLTILNPNKVQDVVLLKHGEYTNYVMRLKTVQNYVNNLFNRGEINEEQKNLMRPKATQIGRPYELPKTHKLFQRLLKFQSVIDTMNTRYQNIGKLLISLLNLLAQNEYVVKNSFEAAAKIFHIVWQFS